MKNELQVRNMIENWAAAVRNRDMDSIMAHHAGDMVMFDVPPPFQSKGIEAYRDTWHTSFKYARPAVFNFHDLQVIAGRMWHSL